MAIQTTCPHCSKSFRVKNDNAVGRQTRCPNCTQSFVIQPSQPNAGAASAATSTFKGESIVDENSPYELTNLAQAAAAETQAKVNPSSLPVAKPIRTKIPVSNPIPNRKVSREKTLAGPVAKAFLWCLGVVVSIALIFAVRVSIRLIRLRAEDPKQFEQVIDSAKSYWSDKPKKNEAPANQNTFSTNPGFPTQTVQQPRPSIRPQPAVITTPQNVNVMPPPAPRLSEQEFIALLAPSAQNDAKLAEIATKWKTPGGEDLLPSLTGSAKKIEHDALLLPRWQKFTSQQTFTPPVTFQAVVFNNTRDLRFAHVLNQLIFNWEMQQDELRIDGSPISGQHKMGAGRLPDKTWVGIEWIILPNEMIIYVDGEERYRAQADFSGVNKPFTIWSHNGISALKELKVVKGDSTH